MGWAGRRRLLAHGQALGPRGGGGQGRGLGRGGWRDLGRGGQALLACAPLSLQTLVEHHVAAGLAAGGAGVQAVAPEKALGGLLPLGAGLGRQLVGRGRGRGHLAQGAPRGSPAAGPGRGLGGALRDRVLHLRRVL